MLLLVAALVAAFTLERLIHVVVTISGASSVKSLAGIQVFGGLVTSSSQLVSSTATVVLGALSVLFQWMVASVVVLVFAGVVWLLCSTSSDLMFELGRVWNSGLGGTLQVTLVWPAKLLAMLSDAVVPLWNVWCWVTRKVPSQILVSTISNDMATLQNICVALVGMAKASAGSIVVWLTTFGSCSICDVDLCDPTCLDVGPRVLDLITPMSYVRQVVMWLTVWARTWCAVMAAPLEMATYPFLDINLAYAIHWLGNAVLWAFVQMPSLTIERCSMYGSESPVMCIPDFEPVFTMTATGVRALGTMVDNWLDVSVLVVQATLGRALPTCTQLPDLLRNLDFNANFFGANTTVVVGMTDSMFARTDGVGIQYFSLVGDWQTRLNPNAFPFPIDVDYGVAAVAYTPNADHDARGDDTTALMGCGCVDGAEGLVITCGVATMGSSAVVPVQFQLPSTAHFAACSRLKINVKSVRWPVTQSGLCSSKSKCQQVCLLLEKPEHHFLVDLLVVFVPVHELSLFTMFDVVLLEVPLCSPQLERITLHVGWKHHHAILAMTSPDELDQHWSECWV
jgi:hypothetical protein